MNNPTAAVVVFLRDPGVVRKGDHFSVGENHFHFGAACFDVRAPDWEIRELGHPTDGQELDLFGNTIIQIEIRGSGSGQRREEMAVPEIFFCSFSKSEINFFFFDKLTDPPISDERKLNAKTCWKKICINYLTKKFKLFRTELNLNVYTIVKFKFSRRFIRSPTVWRRWRLAINRKIKPAHLANAKESTPYLPDR